MFNQEYLPCNRQIYIKISDEELKLIRERMEQLGFKNMSAYIRKMAIDGYCINVDFTAIHELHIPENRNASSATSEQRSAPNRMNNYNAIMMAGSYLVHSSPDDRSVQPVGG